MIFNKKNMSKKRKISKYSKIKKYKKKYRTKTKNRKNKKIKTKFGGGKRTTILESTQQSQNQYDWRKGRYAPSETEVINRLKEDGTGKDLDYWQKLNDNTKSKLVAEAKEDSGIGSCPEKVKSFPGASTEL